VGDTVEGYEEVPSLPHRHVISRPERPILFANGDEGKPSGKRSHCESRGFGGAAPKPLRKAKEEDLCCGDRDRKDGHPPRKLAL